MRMLIESSITTKLAIRLFCKVLLAARLGRGILFKSIYGITMLTSFSLLSGSSRNWLTCRIFSTSMSKSSSSLGLYSERAISGLKWSTKDSASSMANIALRLESCILR